MCGRYGLFAELNKLAKELGFPPHPARSGCRPSWNIAPSASILVVSAPTSVLKVGMMRWGMSPAERGLPSSRLLFNAHGETLSERPTFRSAFESRRCLIPANGFYEWRSAPEGKSPVWVHWEDERPFAFAGLREHDLAAIVAGGPNSLMRPIHGRMQVILSLDEYELWLDRGSYVSDLGALLTSREWTNMATRPISRTVNRVGTYGPGLAEWAEATARRVGVHDVRPQSHRSAFGNPAPQHPSSAKDSSPRYAPIDICHSSILSNVISNG